MNKDESLLADLIPRLTNRIEDAATDALSFILNKSPACRKSLNHLLTEGEEAYAMAPLERFETQVTYDDKSRPDMLGCDQSGNKRLIVESKFWHSLGENQANGYFDQLEPEEPGVLLFIAPALRLEVLWNQIMRQMEASSVSPELEEIKISGPMRRAKFKGAGYSSRRILLVSWLLLLDRLSAAASNDPLVASDLVQLRGLAHSQGDEAYQPLQPEDFSPVIAHRARLFHKLIKDAVERGKSEGWMSTKGLNPSRINEVRGQYLRFQADNWKADDPSFLCVNYDLWAKKGDTPLWLLIKKKGLDTAELKADKLSLAENVKLGNNTWRYGVPLRLITGVEQSCVLDDLVDQIKNIWHLFNKGDSGN